ncbi:MAG: hypothetical protein ACFB10_17360 [Salibacteraceae bacterium]
MHTLALALLLSFSHPAAPVESPAVSATSITVEYITFTLVNKTARSIPLIIPTVMNPNLSPFSRSGVRLKVGQKIFFKEGGKRHLLLQVSADIDQDANLDVAKLLKQRRAELGLRKKKG